MNYKVGFDILLSIFYVQFIHSNFIIPLLKINCFIIDAETTSACEKKEKRKHKGLRGHFYANKVRETYSRNQDTWQSGSQQKL